MKKLFILILSIITIIMCVCLSGCEEYDNAPIDKIPQQSETNSTFCLVSIDTIDDSKSIYVVYDKTTKVMYMIAKGSSMNGYSVSVVVMVDENGKPLLYEGDSE